MADASYIAGGLLAGAGKGLVDMALETVRQQKAETLQRMQIEAADRRSDRQMAHQTNLKGMEIAAQEPERKARVGLLRAQSGYYDERARGGGSGTTKGMVVVDKRDGTVYGADYEPPPGEEGHFALVPSSTANQLIKKGAKPDIDTTSGRFGLAENAAKELVDDKAGYFRSDSKDFPWAGGSQATARKMLADHIYRSIEDGATYADALDAGKTFMERQSGKGGGKAPPKTPAPATRQAGKPGDAQADSVFDPEGVGYDAARAKASGMRPAGADAGENAGHMGSVTRTTTEERQRYGLPNDSYVILKGRSHETWDKAVAAEEARGFQVVKKGDRYFSVPATGKKAEGGQRFGSPADVKAAFRDGRIARAEAERILREQFGYQ